jgi:DNA (cytosine-5)-methyltransferase 1
LEIGLLCKIVGAESAADGLHLRHFLRSKNFFATFLDIFSLILKTFATPVEPEEIDEMRLIKMKENKIKTIDLFAGIGGIRLGFEQAFGDEMETVLVSEIDKKALQTYRANFDVDALVVADITKVPAEDVPAFDVCLAGFPCQAFSVAGKRLGFEDTRGTLFYDVARICKYHQPKVIFCENVKGLMQHDKGRTYQTIKNTFEELGYTVYEKILNSKNYGVPQQRERLYIVAFRNDIDASDFCFPEPRDTSKRLRDIIEDTAVDGKYYLSARYVDCLREHRRRHEEKGHGFGYEILSMDGIANTIVCGGSGRSRNIVVDHRQTEFKQIRNKGEINREGLRMLTPREMARLQGFPESYRLPVADTHLYKQFGNSVTVPVIRAIAEEIAKILQK